MRWLNYLIICLGMTSMDHVSDYSLAYHCHSGPFVQVSFIFIICLFKGSSYTLRGGKSVILFCFPSEEGSILKGKNLLPLGGNSFLLE